jgi:hypothetical protein
MAVVQISKIQVRRGQKNSNSGVPQLSSAEFAWAVDSQELFIGNGSVLEGAPYVGNTKILTEHDNILDLASSYQFASDDTSITLSVPRSLQSKIDEIQVSVADFNAVGDGSTDCVAAFETAFTQLFRNANSNFKKVLLIPNGEYLFSSDLTIPDGVILQGETQIGVELNMGASNIRFITGTGLELADFNSTNRPQNLRLSNLSIRRTTGQLTLSGVANSVIENIRFLGEYVLGTSVASLSTEPAAVFWENNLAGTRVDNILFKDCYFEGNSVSVKCLQTAEFDTNIKFDNCDFFVSDTAIYVEGVVAQGNRWHIYDCEFEEIAHQAFRSTFGRGTLIQRSTFKNVGNGIDIAANPNDFMVFFGEKVGNVLVDCTSDRQQSAGIVSTTLTAAFTEVYNSAKVNFVDRNYSVIFLSDSFRPLAVFSALNNYTTVTYCLKLGEHTRYGSLSLAIGDDLSVGANGSDVTITDSYTYSPRLITSAGGSLMTNFEFSISKVSNSTGDDSSVVDVTADTLLLSYKNPLATGQTGSISFDVTYGV